MLRESRLPPVDFKYVRYFLFKQTLSSLTDSVLKSTKGGGQFTRFSRALPPGPEERRGGGGRHARLDVFPFAINLESVLFRAECRQMLA